MSKLSTISMTFFRVSLSLLLFKSVFIVIRKLPVVFISVLFVFLFSTKLLALPQNNLTEVKVLVKDESSKERSTGIYNGLARVLVRISGEDDIANSEAAQTILKQASQYMLQYSYENLAVEHKSAFFEENFEVANLDKQNQDALKKAESIKLLKLRFDQPLLVKRLQQEGFPVWVDQRPPLLLWWVREDQGNRKVISDSDSETFSSEAKIRSAFYFASEQKGLGVKLPLMDLQDQKSISVTELWGGYEDGLQSASERYQFSTYVNGRSYYQNGKWQASWRLYLFGEKVDFEDSHESIYALHQNVVNSIAKYLASEYALNAKHAENQVLITVSGIRNIKSYAELEDYFERLVVIESFGLVSVNGNQLTYLITIKEDLKKLERIFAFEKKIVKVTPSLPLESSVFQKDSLINPIIAPASAVVSSTTAQQWFYHWGNTQ